MSTNYDSFPLNTYYNMVLLYALILYDALYLYILPPSSPVRLLVLLGLYCYSSIWLFYLFSDWILGIIVWVVIASLDIGCGIICITLLMMVCIMFYLVCIIGFRFVWPCSLCLWPSDVNPLLFTLYDIAPWWLFQLHPIGYGSCKEPLMYLV